MMRSNHTIGLRAVCILLCLCIFAGTLVSCGGQGNEIPDGYKYATCRGEYFRLFVPTQWTANTESGVSGAYMSMPGNDSVITIAVSMTEVPFEATERPVETEGESAADDADDVETTVGTTGETNADTASATAGTRSATLDDFLAAHLAGVEQMLGFRLEKNLDSTLGGKRAKDITYSVLQNAVGYRYRQVLCKVEGRFYLFTYSTTADMFDQWLDIVDGILENIVFHAVPYDGGEDDRKIPTLDNVPEGMKLVSDNDAFFRFFAPSDWLTVPGSATYQVYASEEDRSNVSVLGYIPNTNSTTYDNAAYWAEVEKEYQSVLKDYTLLSTTTGEKMGDLNATVYEYTYTVGGVSYRARQVVCVYSLMIVTMTYTALPENYDRHIEDVKAMQSAIIFRRGFFG